MSKDLDQATTQWGKMMQDSLNQRFGKDKVGFCLIIATTGAGGTMHMKTSLRHEGLVAFFRELANKIAAGMTGFIIR